MVLQNYQNFTEMYHLLWTTNRNLEYRIYANSFRGNYSFLNFILMYCDLCSQYIQVRKLSKGGNHSRAETIRGNTVPFFLQNHDHVLFKCPNAPSWGPIRIKMHRQTDRHATLSEKWARQIGNWDSIRVSYLPILYTKAFWIVSR